MLKLGMALLTWLTIVAINPPSGMPASALDGTIDTDAYVQTTWLPALAAEPIEVPAWQRHRRGDETEILDRPRWVRHVTGPRETKSDIAARYGFDVKFLREWNPQSLAKARHYLPEGLDLRVRATRVPPPREPITYTAEPGDTWESIAIDHRVDVRDLKIYNRAARADSLDVLDTGREITVWIDPAISWTVNRNPGPEIDPAWLDIPQTAFSAGHPNRGRIKGEPHQLPEIPQLYTRRFDRICHGSSFAIGVIVTAFANFRRDTGYAGQVYIGSISRPRGRRFPPHRSHQSGRDVDIRLPLLPWFETMTEPPPENIDWRAAWGLIDAFLATGQVSMIFLDHDLQRHLYYAAMSMGVSAEELDEVITWPLRQGTKGKKIIRHSKGHDGHIHIRMKCGPDEPDCRTRLRRRP